MAPPQPKPPRPQLKRQKSGLLTGVFNFVSQEVQNFVANATGTVNDEELVGEEEELDDEEYGSEEYEEYEEELKDGSRQGSEPSSSPKSRRHTPPRNKSVRRSPPPEKARKPVPERTSSPRPILARRPSKPQMPGSLFPLSPSPDDDSDNDSRPKRHVHFEGGDSPENAVDLTDGGGPSNSRSPSKHREPPPTTPTQKPRFTSPSITGSPSSVRSVVERFQDAEADPAMLLPIHPPSPTRPRRGDNPLPERSLAMSGRTKGKAPAKPYDRTFGTSKSSASTHHREEAISEMAPPPPPLNPKPIPTSTSSAPSIGGGGDAELKIQLLEQEVQRLRDELARRPPRQSTPLLNTGFGLPPPPPPPPPPPTGTIFRVPIESSSSNLDKVFTSVRAALKHNTPPKEKPINKMNGKACIGVPPDKMAAFLTELKTVRLKKVDRSFASEGDVSHSFAQHDRTFDHSFGVGIASEKRKRALKDDHTSGELQRALKRRSMSMSNLKASNNGERSFGSSSSTTRNASANSSFESTTSTSASNTSSTSQPSSSSQQHLLPAALSRSHNLIREWRTGSASTSSSQTDALTPSLCSDQDGGESHDEPGPTTPPSNILHFRPPTPPLQKDNSARDILPEELQYEISLRAPPSPVSPPPSAGYPLGPPAPPPAARRTPVGNDGGDSSMVTTTMTRQRTTSTTKFDKRQPVSPLPDKSPRRPRPPARPLNITNNSKNLPRRVLVMSEDEHEDGDEEEEDPLSLSFDRTASRSLPLSHSHSLSLSLASLSQTQTQPRPRYSLPRRVVVPPPVPVDHEVEGDDYEATPTPAPKPSLFPPQPPQRVADDSSNSRRASSASRSIIRRRQTLDEELRLAAADHSLLQDETLGDLGFDDEDTVYMGMGTMEQRGFLAHGGGGGPAVYMDPGY